VVAALGALALVVGPILLLLPTMAASIGILSGAFGMLSLSMLPITAVVLGITAAIVAGIIIYKNWDKIVKALKVTFEKVFNFISAIVKKVFTAITDIYNSKLGWLLPAGPLVKAIFFLRDNWEAIFNTIKVVFSKVTGAVMTTALSFKTRIVNVFSGIKDGIVGAFTSVKDRVLGIWDGMVSGIKGAINSVIGAINGFIRSINAIRITVPGVDIPLVGRVGGFSVGMPQIPEIPSLAKGGIVNRPTLAMLGESGPEAVVPLGRGRGAGMTINLVINGDVNGFDDFQTKVTAVVRDAVLGGGFSGVLARA